MFAANSMSQSNSNPMFVDLATLQGSGETTNFPDSVTGILLGIEMRTGTYEVTDRKTGQKIERPNSWISHWQVGDREVLMSWPTYEQDGNVLPWSRYDKSINLNACSQQGIVLHFWKDKRNFYHLEVVEEQRTQTIATMPIMAQQPQAQQPAGIPWQR